MKKTFSKKFNSNPDLLPKIEKYILQTISKEYELSDAKINNIEIAIAEAAANSIIHGNKANSEKFLTLNITLFKRKIVLSFKDEGNGFNPDKVPDPTAPENILKGSGRGLHIMRTLVDDMSYNFKDGGTEIILSFNL